MLSKHQLNQYITSQRDGNVADVNTLVWTDIRNNQNYRLTAHGHKLLSEYFDYYI
jgi:hypothetical protein